MTFVLYTFSYQFSAYIIFLSENWTGVCKKLYWHLTTYLSLENPHTFVLYTKCSIKPFLKPTITTKIILKEYLSQGKTPLQIQPQTGCLQSLFQGDVEFHFKLWFQSLLFKCKLKRHKVFIQVTALLILVSTGTFVSLCREVSNWHVRLPFAIQTFSYHRNLGPDSIKIPSSIYCTETHPVPLKKSDFLFFLRLTSLILATAASMLACFQVGCYSLTCRHNLLNYGGSFFCLTFTSQSIVLC